jgi:hypothetical protein
MARERLDGGHSDRDPRVSVLADPTRLELMDLSLLEALVSHTAPSGPERAPRLLEQCVILQEIARRNGQRPRLIQAAAVAERAVRSMRTDGLAKDRIGKDLFGKDWGRDDQDAVRIFAAARLQQALCALERWRLFAEADGLDDARGHLTAAEQALGDALSPRRSRLSGPNLINARLSAAYAMMADDSAVVAAGCNVFDEAIAALDRRVRTSGAGLHDLALARCERAELLISAGQRLKDAAFLQATAKDMEALCAELDPDYLPQSLARAQSLRGTALRSLGDSTGEAHLMKAAAGAFRAALDTIPSGHSPLDRARAAHGLGLALQGLAEAAGDVRLYRSALFAMDRALCDLPRHGLPLRAVVAHDRAACLARRAERNGDLGGLAEAEGAFKAELSEGQGQDAVAWALTQVALARIYEVRADLAQQPGERSKAAYALIEALDVFAERGLKSLSEVAQAALERVRDRHSQS